MGTPSDKIQAMDRALECGMDTSDGLKLFKLHRDGGSDINNLYTAKQQQCYTKGPEIGFFEEAVGWRTTMP